MADFYAVQSGPSASGYLIANGNVYPAVSGTSSLQSIPSGDYTHGEDLALRVASELPVGSWSTNRYQPGALKYDMRARHQSVSSRASASSAAGGPVKTMHAMTSSSRRSCQIRS